MPWSVTLIANQSAVKLRFNKLRYKLLLVISVDFEAKNSLKSLAFSLKLVKSLLPIFSDCIRDIFSIYESFSDKPKCFRACSWISQLVSSLIVVITCPFTSNGIWNIINCTLQKLVFRTSQVVSLKIIMLLNFCFYILSHQRQICIIKNNYLVWYEIKRKTPITMPFKVLTCWWTSLLRNRFCRFSCMTARLIVAVLC